MANMRRATNLVVAAAIAAGLAACGTDDDLGMREAALTPPPGTTEATLVQREAVWRYYYDVAAPPSTWKTTTPTSWRSGFGPLGYGENYLHLAFPYGSDPSNKPVTAYFAAPFTVTGDILAMELRVMYDDGFAFYLNGREGGRAYMPGGAITHTTLALGHEANNRYHAFDISAQIPNLEEGSNLLAFEVHQVSRSSSDLVFDAELVVWRAGGVEEITVDGIPREALWRYYDNGGLGSAWSGDSTDDSGWAVGQAPLGYGESYIETPTAPDIITYFRHTFRVDDIGVSSMIAEVMYDDGFVAYLNGTEIGRASMPPGPPNSTTPAYNHEAAGYQVFDWTAARTLLRPGENLLAVEVHNTAYSSSDLVFDLALTLEHGWSRQASGTTADLRGVWFTDAENGWAVGDGGTLRRTTDGGATWTGQASGTTEDLTAIQFADASHGWIAGEGGGVLTTSDGGATWSYHALGGSFTGLDLVTADAGFLSRTDDVVVELATGGGGITTSEHAVGTGSFVDLDFVDGERGWIAGAVPVPDDNWAAIYATTDGGETWTQQWVSGVYHFYLHDVEVIDADTVWAVGQGSLSGASEHKLVTHDGGATWTDAPRSANNVGLFAIDFVGARGWGVGVGGSIVATTDGGATWHAQRAFQLYDLPWLHGVHVVDGDTGWAVGDDGAIYKTTTGGE